MNTKSFLSLLMSAAMSPAVLAADIFPVTNPKCNLAISQPDNSSGYYLNSNCTAGFVLPPKSGTVRVEAVHDLGNLDMCPGLSKARLRGEKYQDQADKMLARLDNPNLTPQQKADIRADIELINKMIVQNLEPYDLVPAATVHMSYTMPSIDQWVGEFLRRNPNVGADYRLKFYPAPISDGILVFSALDQAKGKIKLNPVIMANIPNMRPAETDPSRFTGTAIVSNGDMSGQLTLSLAGVCGANVKPGESSTTLADRQALAANLVANVTYTVPVMANVGYTAKLDSEIAIENWTSQTEVKTQFTKREFGDIISSGTAGVAFFFELTDFGAYTASPEEQKNLYGQLRGEVRERLVGNLVNQMEAAGFLEMSAPAPKPDAPAPGTVDEVHTRRECSSNSGFFGIGASSSCSDIPYVIKIPHGSEGSVVLKKVNNTTFKNQEAVVINQVMQTRHTGTFLPAKN